MCIGTSLKLTLSFANSKAHLTITNILKFNSVPNSVFSFFDGVRLKNIGTKGRALYARMMKNIVLWNGKKHMIRDSCDVVAI